MARNKYPEQTVEKIIDAAIQMFLEKGYDGTSMQDIVKVLGMSKGAIYHHFKSKEELFEKAILAYYSRQNWMETIYADPTRTMLEKLRAMLLHEMTDQEKLSVDRMYFASMNDPRILWQHIQMNIQEGGPEIARFIEEGNRDGSMQVAYPLEAAELLMLLANVWIGLFSGSKEQYERQIAVCAQVMEGLGLPLFDEELTRRALEYYDRSALAVHRQRGNSGKPEQERGR